MQASATDIYTRALGICGIFAPGDIIPGEDAGFAFATLNTMVDSWNTESLFVYTIQDVKVGGVYPVLPTNTNILTIGPTGSIVVTERPTQLMDTMFVRINSVDYPVRLINQEQYNSLNLKTNNSSYPMYCYCDYEYPTATLYFYPIPNQPCELHIQIEQQLIQFPDVGTKLNFPQGYVRALQYALAVELSGSYGRSLSPTDQKVAAKAIYNIKRRNNQTPELGFRNALLDVGGAYNIFLGQ